MAEPGSTERGSRLRRLHERLLNPPLETGSTRLLVRREADGWTISEPAAPRPLRRLLSRDQALRAATSTLAEFRGGQIEVTEEDGSTQLIPVARGKRPWWRVTQSPLSGLLLGLLWLGLFVIRVLDSEWPPGWGVDTVALVVTGLCAALYLPSSVLRVVRDARTRTRGQPSRRRGGSGD